MKPGTTLPLVTQGLAVMCNLLPALPASRYPAGFSKSIGRLTRSRQQVMAGRSVCRSGVGSVCSDPLSPSQHNPFPGRDEQLEIKCEQVLRVTHPQYFSAEKPHIALKQGEKPTVAHFEWGNDLGEGAFGMVRRVKMKSTGVEYAVKVLDKKHVVKMEKVKYVTSERDILFKLDHPNIIKLYWTFQDTRHLYFVMELATGGELFEQIQKFGPANMDCARFYAAEIISALEYLHSKGVVHRDLKPENMLVAASGHIKLSDFGSATVQQGAGAGGQTFVGTAQYVSPEVLNGQTAGQSADLWALGCVVFQLLAGHPPFCGDTDYLIFQKILSRDFEYPSLFPAVARDLVDRLLVLDPEARLGAGGDFASIRAHSFFAGVEFESLPYEVPPPYKTVRSRSVSSAGSTSHRNYCAIPSFARPPLDVVEIQRLCAEQGPIIERWQSFLLPNEAVILTDTLHKRVGLFSRARQFILTSFPRLFYIQTERMEFRGEIPWHTIRQLERRNSSTLYIHTDNRVYYLENVADCDLWIGAINFLKRIS